jgi:hypothetical protein
LSTIVDLKDERGGLDVTHNLGGNLILWHPIQGEVGKVT